MHPKTNSDHQETTSFLRSSQLFFRSIALSLVPKTIAIKGSIFTATKVSKTVNHAQKMAATSDATMTALTYKMPKYIQNSLLGAIGGYVMYDTIQEAYRVRDQGTRAIAIKGLDTFIWQASASVIIPTIAIKSLMTISNIGLNKLGTMMTLHPITRFIPIVVGLSSIPFIVEPIGTITEKIMDATIRQCYDLPEINKNHIHDSILHDIFSNS